MVNRKYSRKINDKLEQESAHFIQELEMFFDTVDQSNFFKPETYEILIVLLKKYKDLFGNSEKVIERYNHFFSISDLSQWQEDVYIEVQTRLTGFSADNKRVVL